MGNVNVNVLHNVVPTHVSADSQKPLGEQAHPVRADSTPLDRSLGVEGQTGIESRFLEPAITRGPGEGGGQRLGHQGQR